MVLLRFCLIALMTLGVSFSANSQSVMRLRGTILAVDADTVGMRTREGAEIKIKLSDKTTFSSVSAINIEAIAPGSYIGTSAVADKDGTFTAQEVVVFPEAMKGTNEGKFPWDLTPDSTMINAIVSAATLVSGQGRELILTQKGETSKEIIPSGVPIVTLAPTDRKTLVVGSPAFVVVQVSPDQSLTATRMVLGKDGVAPPM